MENETVIYEVTCRTYDCDGEFMNAEVIYVDVPADLAKDDDSEELYQFLTEACTEEMCERCEDDETWEVDEWCRG